MIRTVLFILIKNYNHGFKLKFYHTRQCLHENSAFGPYMFISSNILWNITTWSIGIRLFYAVLITYIVAKHSDFKSQFMIYLTDCNFIYLIGTIIFIISLFDTKQRNCGYKSCVKLRICGKLSASGSILSFNTYCET